MSTPSLRGAIVAAALVLAAACGKDAKFADAGPDDGGEPIDATATIDARPPLPAYELTGGAQGLSGKRFRADVQIGHGIGQQPASGGGVTVEGNAAVKR